MQETRRRNMTYVYLPNEETAMLLTSLVAKEMDPVGYVIGLRSEDKERFFATNVVIVGSKESYDSNVEVRIRRALIDAFYKPEKINDEEVFVSKDPEFQGLVPYPYFGTKSRMPDQDLLRTNLQNEHFRGMKYFGNVLHYQDTLVFAAHTDALDVYEHRVKTAEDNKAVIEWPEAEVKIKDYGKSDQSKKIQESLMAGNAGITIDLNSKEAIFQAGPKSQK